MSNLEKFEHWSNPSKGIYRYVISAGACYEIHLLYCEEHHGEYLIDKETTKAALYLAGDWFKNVGSDKPISFFQRECLLKEGTIQECLKKAVEDDEEYNNA